MAAPENGLFKTPDEVREEYKKRLKGSGGGGANWYTDRVKGGVTFDEDGNIKRDGPAWYLQLFEKEGFAETAAQRNKDLKNSAVINNATSLVDRDDLKKAAGNTKITADNVGGLVRAAEKITREKPTPLQKANITRLAGIDQEGVDARKAANAISLATLKSNDAYRMFESGERANERAFNRKENDLNRRQERELSDSQNSLQMQMAIMQNDLAEKRMDYDRETRSMDKRDRMIAQLMSGLGSLGSAFG